MRGSTKCGAHTTLCVPACVAAPIAAHGVGGEVRVSDIPAVQLSPVAAAFHTAAQQAGHAANPDQNTAVAPQHGVCPTLPGPRSPYGSVYPLVAREEEWGAS